MTEYIERDKAIEKINAYCELRQAICLNDKDEFLRGLQTALKAISYNDVIPASDVQPVKRGKWVYYKNNGIWDIHKCTVCNTPFELPMDVVASSVFCYCPHCGADMRDVPDTDAGEIGKDKEIIC